ncbi:MAG: NAD(P)H-dependent oxidoreductase [Gemmatimonadota bacterium]|nr:NAD(P)H-dependent oxidoreductase [Gemmatimonadota bacterium]
MKQIKMLGFAGSLRKASFNRALLRATTEVAPGHMEIDVFDLADVPLYNGDIEAEGDPEPVAALKRAIHAADGVVIATPEYNQGMPAVTKNAIDWASRPPKPQAWDGKPVVIMGASPGRLGTVSAQRSLRETLSAVNARVMPQSRVLLSGAGKAFESGMLVDEATRERLGKFMNQAAEWIARLEEAAA